MSYPTIRIGKIVQIQLCVRRTSCENHKNNSSDANRTTAIVGKKTVKVVLETEGKFNRLFTTTLNF